MTQDKPLEPALRWYWLVGLAQAVHSGEEIAGRLYAFADRAPPALAGLARRAPFDAMSGDTFAVVNLVIVAALLGSVPLVRPASRVWRAALLAVAITEIANGLAHAGGSLLFGVYVPGAVSGLLLVAAAVGLLRAVLRRPPA